MRELPRQLSAEELAELFEGRTRLVELLATREDPLGSADDAIAELDEAEKLEALNAHPAIGARSGLSARSAAEQGADADPVILTELAYLNQVYEEKFGFRFVVFVNGRPKTEILEVLRGRLERTREEELETALRELVAIARDRWEKSLVDPYANEWLSFLARWLHVMAGIVWIGTSFYFVALDNHLRENESWEIHGGGFYRVEKFMPAPPRLPDVLHWFKWEAYTTWLSGFALLVFLYYFNATTYLVRPGGPLGTGWSIAVSIVLLGVAWVVYDVLCRVDAERARAGRAGARPDDAGGVGRDRAVRAAGRLRPGRRDARDDHGGERLLRDHPRPPRADPREGGLPRARPGPGARGQAALGAQQLPDAAGRVRDAEQPLPERVHAQLLVARAGRADGDRRLDQALLQPAACGPERLVDPADGGARNRGGRGRDPADRRLRRCRRGRDGLVRAGACDRRAALRAVPLGASDPGSRRAARDRARHRGADPRAGRRDPAGGGRLAADAARERDRDDPGERDELGAWIRAGARIK